MEGGSDENTWQQFAESKWNNFCKRYQARLLACGLLQQAQELGVQQFLVYVAQIKPFWVYLRERDVDSLIALFEVSDFGNKDAVLQQFREMQGEPVERDMFWKYVDLFLDLASL